MKPLSFNEQIDVLMNTVHFYERSQLFMKQSLIAQKKINLKHTNSSLNKPGFVGYCWTYFFFSFFVPIFRGEILIGVLHLIFSVVTFGLFQLVIPFLYNKQFTSRMLTSGWELSDTEENMQAARLKLGIGN